MSVPAGVSPSFPPEKVEQVRRLGRQGLGGREICRQAGTHHHNVRPILAELMAAGERPDTCPCGMTRGPAHSASKCPFSSAPPKRYPKVRESRLPKETVADLYRRFEAGESQRSITRTVGIAYSTVSFHKRRWLDRRDRPLPPCRCGRPARHPGGCIVNSPSLLSHERRRQIRTWARSGMSAAEMVRRSRKSANIHSVLKYATPVWEAMAADGTFCGCGQRHGHVGTCTATWDSDERVRGPQPIPVEEQKRILNGLLNGDSLIAIRRNVPTSHRRLNRVLGAMTDQERHRRKLTAAQRMTDGGERLHGADLFRQVQAAVPKQIEASVRDEVVSELCLAIVQGDLTLEHVHAHAKRFVGKAFTTWASGFGPKSLDEAIGDDGDRTLVETISDDTAEMGLFDMELGL